MTLFGLIFLCALGLATTLKLWLAWRHINHVQAHRGAVPAQFASEIGLDAHQRAADYTCAKTRLAMASVAVDVALVLWLTFGGGLQAMHDVTTGWFNGDIARGMALLVLLTLIMTIIELPLSLFRTFRIEERFGFNRMTLGVFFTDM
ncbi:MAG: M48 family peptidase, partial [Betaproteobacteria bacterium]|nr:M48 family peptidase [Betaproteobacteria bacterium]